MGAVKKMMDAVFVLAFLMSALPALPFIVMAAWLWYRGREEVKPVKPGPLENAIYRHDGTKLCSIDGGRVKWNKCGMRSP